MCNATGYCHYGVDGPSKQTTVPRETAAVILAREYFCRDYADTWDYAQAVATTFRGRPDDELAAAAVHNAFSRMLTHRRKAFLAASGDRKPFIHHCIKQEMQRILASPRAVIERGKLSLDWKPEDPQASRNDVMPLDWLDPIQDVERIVGARLGVDLLRKHCPEAYQIIQAAARVGLGGDSGRYPNHGRSAGGRPISVLARDFKCSCNHIRYRLQDAKRKARQILHGRH